MGMRTSFGERVFQVFNHLFLLGFSFVTLYPFWYVIILSLTNPRSYAQTYLWPREYYWVNYMIVFGTPGIMQAYLITLLRVAVAVPLMLLVTGAMAFGLSRRELKFRKSIIVVLFITMFFSGGLIPSYMTMKALGLINTFWIYVFPSVFSVWTMIVIKTSIQGLPDGLVEAALIDGAGYGRIFLMIILPLSLPMFATLGLFAAVSHWNDWFTGAFYVSNTKLKPLQTFLQTVIKRDSTGLFETMNQGAIDLRKDPRYFHQVETLTPQALEMAYIVVSTVPILLLYPWLQKYFVKGVLIGSIKG